MTSLSGYALATDANELVEIEKITVSASPTANKLPVGTFDAPVSNLEYDPRVDLQSRNMAEAQADVTIRGGIFENTGFSLGSATLFDPQTGHYFAEIPIAPHMLSGPTIHTGVDNALYGMNSSVGTVAFGWRPINTGGSLSLGAGTNDFNLHSINAGLIIPLEGLNDWQFGVEGEYSHSQSDGSVDYGDHDFTRVSGRVQLQGPQSQTDIFYGSQQKFFGWPNMYTPFGVNETEELDTTLLMFNHKLAYASNSDFEVSAYYRKNNDHYIYSRENPHIFEAFHETEVKSIGFSGRHAQSQSFALHYSAQFIEDSIDSTTLENNFTSRNYYKLSVLPEYQTTIANNQLLTVRLGATYDDTNRDDSKLSLLGDINWNSVNTDGSERTVYLSFAQASQVAGYTAIGGSDSGGLFRSNYNLERETTQNLELGLLLEQQTWQLNSALFYRQDENLTDWTYSFDSVFARAANPVDIDTSGVEFLATKHFDTLELISSYSYLHKSETYSAQDIDASFYALNFPDHRITLGAIWQPSETVELRIDNEWRVQHDNDLRTGDDNALFTHLTLTFIPSSIDSLLISFSADNLWGESFEEIPGTPGRGEQYTLSATYSW
jgi:hypothetical protein